MVVKRISRRRKKSSSPRKRSRRRSRRKSKQKKRSRVKKKSVRRRSKNKLEGGTGFFAKIQKKQDAATEQLLSEYAKSNPGVGRSGQLVAARQWRADQKKKKKEDAANERKATLALWDDQFKKGVEDAKDSIEKQKVENLKNLKKTGLEIRGKTYVLLVKKNEDEGSTCVYKLKNEKITFEKLVSLFKQKGVTPISDQEKTPRREGLSRPDDASAGEQVHPVSAVDKKINAVEQERILAAARLTRRRQAQRARGRSDIRARENPSARGIVPTR
jgi:hypothetical protein